MEYLTMTEAAEKLRVDKRTIEKLIKRGELKAIKFSRTYRIPVDAFDALTVEASR